MIVAQRPRVEAFTFRADDPLAEEHVAVSACIEEVFVARGGYTTGARRTSGSRRAAIN
jgi:hypothetical protein